MSETLIKKKRSKIPGKSLYEKYKYLYNENPKRDHNAYIELLGISKGTSYTLKHQLRKELGDAYEGPAGYHIGKLKETSKKPISEGKKSTVEVSASASELEELRALNGEVLDNQRMTERPFIEPWDECPFDVSQQPTQPINLARTAPSPVFDISLTGVDGATVQSFLRLINERPTPQGKYTLEIKLIEH